MSSTTRTLRGPLVPRVPTELFRSEPTPLIEIVVSPGLLGVSSDVFKLESIGVIREEDEEDEVVGWNVNARWFIPGRLGIEPSSSLDLRRMRVVGIIASLLLCWNAKCEVVERSCDCVSG